jgi:hypothetical protein
MTRGEARYYLDNQSWSFIIRSLLMYEIDRVRYSEDRIEPRTLRSLWYTLIKPALEKLGALEESYYTMARSRKKNDVGKIPDWSAKLSKYLVELVDNGITSYEELRVIDESRPRRPPQGNGMTVHTVDLIDSYNPNIVLFTEKDTIYNVVRNIGSVYGISAISGSGEPSYAATENLIKRIVRHENFLSGNNIYLLSLTDYDPAGYTISETIHHQMEKVASTLNGNVSSVIHSRLGLEPEQLTPSELEKNTYTPKSQGLQKWFKLTNGVNGRPLGIELDALPISRLRQMFVDGIQSIISNEDKYHGDLAAALVETLIWEALDPQITKMRDSLREKINATTIIKNLSCPDGTLALFATNGFDHVDPLEYDKYVFKAADDIRNKIKVNLPDDD